MLVLLTFYVARRIEGVTGGVLLGVLVFLAFMAKQSDLIAVAPVVACVLVIRRRAGVTGALTAAGIGGVVNGDPQRHYPRLVRVLRIHGTHPSRGDVVRLEHIFHR